MDEVIKDYLSHHGIPGQKWGVQNGPPYPLSISAHSIAEKKANWQKSINKKEPVGGNISPNTVIASAYIGIYASMVISKLIKNQMIVSKGKKFVQQFENENASDKKSPKSIDSKDINPLNGKMNCGACCISEEMRIRGTSCAAKNINGMLIKDVAACFKGANENSFDRVSTNCISKTGNGKETRDNIGAEIVKKYPEGSRGCMYMPMWFGNHYITWEVKDGKTNFKNPQNSKVDLTNDCFSAMIAKGTPGANQVGIRTMRWDNLEFNKDSTDEILYTDRDSLNKRPHTG